MALTYDQVTAVTHKLINESAADNIYTASPLFLHLKEKGRISKDGGDQIKLPIVYAELAAGGAFANYDLLSTLPTDNMTAAEYEWKRYYINVVVSQHELLRNQGESGAVNLLRAKVQAGEMQMRENLSDDLFSTNGDSAKGIIGLRTMVDATGTVGKIAQSDFSGWASDEDNTASALAISLLQKSILDASVGTDRPDIIVTTKGVYAKLLALYQNVQRFGSERTAKGGFEFAMVDGVPVFWDVHCPGSATSASTADKHIFLLNSRHLYLFFHSGDDFKTQRIPAIAEQDIVVNRTTVTLAFATDNRRMHSKFTVMKY